MKSSLIALILLLCADFAGAGMVLSLDNGGLLSWTGGVDSGYYDLGYYSGLLTGTPQQAWAYQTITNNGLDSQSIDVPWLYRMVLTSNAVPADLATNAVPASWSPVATAMIGWTAHWRNLDDKSPYALAWKYALTDSVWQMTWNPFQNMAATSTGMIRVPFWFSLFLKDTDLAKPACMVTIPGNYYVMGDATGVGQADERPTRSVYVTRFAIDATEVTEAQWETVRSWAAAHDYTDLPSGVRSGTNYPVRGISWFSAAKWLNARSEMDGEIPSYRLTNGFVFRAGTAAVVRLEAFGYRLPTEAEWEKAARGGSAGAYPFAAGPWLIWAAGLDAATNYLFTTNPLANFRGYPKTNLCPIFPVQSIFKGAWAVGDALLLTDYRSQPAYSDANAFGLHNVLGNVSEFCDNWYSASEYQSAATNDPTGPATGIRKVLRGGTYCSKESDIRVSRRMSIRPSDINRGVGFRAVKRSWPAPSGKQLLVVFNVNSADSVTLKDFYLANRPGISDAAVLAVGCTTNEIIPYVDFTNQILAPVLAVLATNANLRFVVMLYGMPSRISGNGDYSPQYWIDGDGAFPYRGNKTHFLKTAYPGTRAIVTYITGRTLADCTSYIARVAARYDGINSVISGNVANAWYVFDDVARVYSDWPIAQWARDAVLDANTNAMTEYRALTNAHVSVWTNLAGYMTWGVNGSMPASYATDGTITFQGTNWYIIETAESFNGQLNGGHGNYGEWFSKTAFGSTNYEHCPIGAVCYVEEPYITGLNSSAFFELWERGLPFGECAASSQGMTPEFMAIGDPLVTK